MSGRFDTAVLALPLAALALHVGHGHSGDMESFHAWYLAVREGPSFYAHAAGINYPIVGVLLVTAPALAVEALLGAPLALGAYVLVLKATLALGELAWIAVAAALAGRLGSPRPWLVAGAAYLVPSTWSVGAAFGQIDTIGSGLVLALLTALHDATSHAPPLRRRASVALVAAACLVVLAKPLPWLALPAVGLGLVRARGTLDLRALAVASGVALVLVAAIDAVVAWPLGAPSSVVLALRAPLSAHGELAAAGGASVWTFFVRSGTSAHVLLAPGLELGTAGNGLFVLVAAAILLLAQRALAAEQAADGRHALTVTAIAASLVGVAAAYLLPGSHERYPAQALAPLVIAGLSVPELRAHRAAVLATATLAGLYVLGSIEWEAFDGWLTPLREPVLLALAQPALVGLGGWMLHRLGRAPAQHMASA